MNKNREILKSLAMINQIGISLMVPIIGCVFAGIYLDRWLNTTPWLLIILMFVGMGVAFRNLYMLARSFANKEKKRP